jgi:hypothetical protein
MRLIKIDRDAGWDSQKLKTLLAQPVGAPIDMNQEEALEIVRLASGRRPDLPAGSDVVRKIRQELGHSLMYKNKKSEPV